MKSNLRFLFIVLSLLTVGSLAHCATITWTNTSGGNWSVAANWNPNGVPGTNDTVIIASAGVIVSLNSTTTVGGTILGTNGAMFYRMIYP